MASLRDARKLTQRLREQANAVHAALTDDEIDFGRIVRLADELGDSADRVAGTFETIDGAFGDRLGGESRSDAEGESPDEETESEETEDRGEPERSAKGS